MSTPLTLRTGVHSDGRPLLAVQGEIDMTNLAAFGGALSAALAEATSVVVDLGEVDYLDSGAINALFSHADHLHIICNPLLLPALRISGLTELVTIESAAARP
ncbi:STAS domain-containing protein [Nocardia sp. NBC_01327]|uniref:STAS domain-containing protein n=1 Tax=Nocardia sp. NBC_01327 TaxID=2903593 RepID=UPI002E1499C4|nr:STAS domain-containing protein [Nocardia sp. NBC_01327]